jgi:hypothetical protein
MQLRGNYEAETHPFEKLPLHHILHTQDAQNKTKEMTSRAQHCIRKLYSRARNNVYLALVT